MTSSPSQPSQPSRPSRSSSGTSAPYRDPSLPVEARIDDLLARMTLAEKAGQMFQQMVPPTPVDVADPSFGIPCVRELVADRHLTHVNLFGAAATAGDIARWHNEVQDVAAGTRLGIPVTVASDPRHAFSDNPGTAAMAGPFSQWPEAMGLAAIGSEQLVEEFADTARREYLAVGIRSGLHPQIDLVTEPRWSRAVGTFGEDSDLSGRLGAAYVRGFQGPVLGPGSVATMPKHFPGGGPQLDGEDPHFDYGKDQVYPGGRFDYHLAPFVPVLAAGARQVMPYYGRPVGLEIDGVPVPEVGFGFNRTVITDVLRGRLGFDGVVCTDWGLITDMEVLGHPMPARAWGLEHATRHERVLAVLDAGCDQFGGEHCPDLVVDLVGRGLLPEHRLDVSVRRLLRVKFALGLFENPFVDPDLADAVVGAPDAVAAGAAAQRASITVLTRAADGPASLAPAPVTGTAADLAVYAPSIDPALLRRHARVVDDPREADLAVLRLKAPFEARTTTPFESYFHAGRLEYTPEELAPVLAVCRAVPTVVDVHLDRPAVLTPLAEAAATLVADYGAGDDALLDVVFGLATARGRLPFDLPSSAAAVEASPTDAPFATAAPLFRFGHGSGA